MGSPVEFVSDGPDGDAIPERRDALGHPPRARSFTALLSRGKIEIAAPASWAAAAALCVTASYQMVFTYRFDGVALHTRGGFDASGRSLDRVLSNEHGPRYAIVLFVCALWFLVLAALLIGKGTGRATGLVTRHAVSVGLAGTFLLVGLLSSIGLGLASTYSSYNGLAGALGEGGGIVVRLHIGACLWLGLAALACAFVGITLTALLQRRMVAASAQTPLATDPAPDDRAPDEPGELPDDELLVADRRHPDRAFRRSWR